MSNGNELITNYTLELVEDHHHPGSGRYGVRVLLPVDISVAFPCLNTVLNNSYYDRENSILIGEYNHQRYALRPHEIQAGAASNQSEAVPVAEAAVELVNRIWRERENISPSYCERKLPAVYDIYRLLPRTNCKECGYPTCLACAADIRNKVIFADRCLLLSRPEYSQARDKILNLMSSV